MPTPIKVKEMFKDIWHLTPAEIADLLQVAAWMCEYPEASSPADRHAIAAQLRRTMPMVNPKGYDNLDGAAEHYRPGVYNGD